MLLPIRELVDFDVRSSIFEQATRFVDYELVEGDIFEFGVYTGRSLALLSHFHCKSLQSIHSVPFQRRVIGLDSFEGLPSNEEHPRWYSSMFDRNHSFHPLCKKGEKVSPTIVSALFKAYQLPEPIIEVGSYDTLLPSLDGKYQKASIVHIDCDLYESTKTVLAWVEPLLQEGSILLFDDWFNFKGSPNRGEQKAFWEYAPTSSWNFLDYRTYATFGKAFISIEKSSEDL